MKKYKLLFSSVFLLLILMACEERDAHRSSLNYHRAQWERSNPSIYYLEVTETQGGSKIEHRSVVAYKNEQPEVVLQRSSPQNNSMISKNGVAVENIFDIAMEQCVSRNTECIIEFDNNFSYLEILAVYDWLGVRVVHFESCENLDSCSSLFGQEAVNQ